MLMSGENEQNSARLDTQEMEQVFSLSFSLSLSLRRMGWMEIKVCYFSVPRVESENVIHLNWNNAEKWRITESHNVLALRATTV